MDAKMEGGADRARSLEVFAAVAAQGSFSAAGRVLGLTPSAVSRTVDRIEARLGVRLLLRTTRALTLTAEGQAYLGAARRILTDLDDAEQAIADQGAPRGRLRVSAALSHGRLCIVPLLGEFARLYPHILVDISLSDSIVDVAAGQADVAIRFGPLADSGLTARKLGENGRVIVASPDYLARYGTPRVPADLHDHNCLNFNFRRAEPIWPFRRDGRDFALSVDGGIVANNTLRAEFIYENLLIATNVIHAAHEHGVEKLLFLGSSCIYPKFAEQPIKEESLLTGELEETNDAYAIAKISGIELIKSYRKQYKHRWISVMPTNLYGPGDNFDLNTSHVLPAMIRKFDDAVKAGQDQERLKSEGEAYANDIIPRAKGTAARLIQEAEGYKARVVATAEGDAARFKQILPEYMKAKQVTRNQMYFETMGEIYSNVTKVLVDTNKSNNLLYLPLDKLVSQVNAETAQATGVPATTNTSTPTGSVTVGGATSTNAGTTSATSTTAPPSATSSNSSANQSSTTGNKSVDKRDGLRSRDRDSR